MSTYSSRLRDPRWQRRRLEIFDLYGWKCSNCQTKTEQLHAHHMIYRKGKSQWEYEDTEIVCLCDGCHEDFTNMKASIDEVFVKFVEHFPSFKYAMQRLLGYMDGTLEKPRMSENSYNAGYLAGRVSDMAQFNDSAIENLLMVQKYQDGES